MTARPGEHKTVQARILAYAGYTTFAGGGGSQ